MNPNQQFQKDLKFGQDYEKVLKEKFEGEYDYCESSMTKGACKEFDLNFYKYTPNGQIELIDEDNKFISNMDLVRSYEVKADRKAVDYGNSLFIEVQCNKKDSGLTTTTSTHYAYFCVRALEVEYDLYIIPTEILRGFIQNKQYTLTYTRAGDRGAVLGHIVPNKLIEHFCIQKKRVGCLIKL
jgi:hypothetical protein